MTHSPQSTKGRIVERRTLILPVWDIATLFAGCLFCPANTLDPIDHFPPLDFALPRDPGDCPNTPREQQAQPEKSKRFPMLPRRACVTTPCSSPDLSEERDPGGARMIQAAVGL